MDWKMNQVQGSKKWSGLRIPFSPRRFVSWSKAQTNERKAENVRYVLKHGSIYPSRSAQLHKNERKADSDSDSDGAHP